jgi:hypothetical protein
MDTLLVRSPWVVSGRNDRKRVNERNCARKLVANSNCCIRGEHRCHAPVLVLRIVLPRASRQQSDFAAQLANGECGPTSYENTRVLQLYPTSGRFIMSSLSPAHRSTLAGLVAEDLSYVCPGTECKVARWPVRAVRATKMAHATRVEAVAADAVLIHITIADKSKVRNGMLFSLYWACSVER